MLKAIIRIKSTVTKNKEIQRIKMNQNYYIKGNN